MDDRWSGVIVLLISSTRIGIRFLKLMALLGAVTGLGHRLGRLTFGRCRGQVRMYPGYQDEKGEGGFTESEPPIFEETIELYNMYSTNQIFFYPRARSTDKKKPDPKQNKYVVLHELLFALPIVKFCWN